MEALHVLFIVVIISIVLTVVIPHLPESYKKTVASVFLAVPAALTLFAIAHTLSDAMSKKK